MNNDTTAVFPSFTLYTNAMGHLVLRCADGNEVEGVVPVRAFPISAPACGLALLDAEGHEVAWIEDTAALPGPSQTVLHAALASREFMPEIQRIDTVSSFATPSQWAIMTDRGATTLTLRAEDDIRRLGHDGLLIADSHGIHYLVRDMQALDRHSRKLLDHFL